MKYTALRPCKFAGTMYLVGDEIPDGVVQDSASKRLIKCGVIEAVVGVGVTPPLAATSVEPKTEQPKEEIETAVEEISNPSNMKKEKEHIVEEAYTEETAEEIPESEFMAETVTVDELVRLKTAELIELAEGYGIDPKPLKKLKKAEIAKTIVEAMGNDI